MPYHSSGLGFTSIASVLAVSGPSAVVHHIVLVSLGSLVGLRLASQLVPGTSASIPGEWVSPVHDALVSRGNVSCHGVRGTVPSPCEKEAH